MNPLRASSAGARPITNCKAGNPSSKDEMYDYVFMVPHTWLWVDLQYWAGGVLLCEWEPGKNKGR